MNENFFFTLAALRIANLATGAEHFSATVGSYRNLVRRFAEEMGCPALGEVAFELIFDPLQLLYQRQCIDLRKFDPVKYEWWDFSEMKTIGELVNRGDFTIKLKPRGRELLAEMEEQITASRVPEQKVIGFR
jgi:hypothetical protein